MSYICHIVTREKQGSKHFISKIYGNHQILKRKWVDNIANDDKLHNSFASSFFFPQMIFCIK